MDDVDTEGINSIATNIVPVYPGDEHLALVIVAEQPTNHGEVEALSSSFKSEICTK